MRSNFYLGWFWANFWKGVEAITNSILPLTLNGIREGTFNPLVLFESYFVCWVLIKNFQTFLEVKIDINWFNLTPCQAHWVFQKMPIDDTKDLAFIPHARARLWLVYHVIHFLISWIKEVSDFMNGNIKTKISWSVH